MGRQKTPSSEAKYLKSLMLEAGNEIYKTAVSALAMIACGAMAHAQEITDLDDIIVDGDSSIGLYGDNIAQSSATVTKTGTSILETPRSVSVVTAQNIADTGAQDVEEVVAYAAGVAGGIVKADPRSDWYNIRELNPSEYHDGVQSRFDYSNVSKPEGYMIESVGIWEIRHRRSSATVPLVGM